MNPFFYLIKKEIKTIHEFLADRFAADGKSQWNYAELLLMQLLGTPTQRLANPFFHNQIKRRIAMITSSPKVSRQYLRKLLVLPVAIFIVAAFAFTYKTKEASVPFQHAATSKPLTVVIDAGHGDGDPGVTTNNGTKESDITLQLAQLVKQLNKNDHIHIVLTRNNKASVDLRKRSDIANAQNPDLFISIHTNASETNTDESGFEVYISKKNEKHSAENKIFGGILLNYFMNIYKTTNKIQQSNQGIWVLDNSNCPSVLVECGYITNEKDLSFIQDKDNQNKIAESILKSIEQFATQKELPDFNDKLKQVADTSKPTVKINKSNSGKIAGEVNGVSVAKIIIDPAIGNAGFVLDNQSIIVISKEQTEALRNEYGTRWDEFCKLYGQESETKTANQQPNKNTERSNSEPVFTVSEVNPSFPGGDDTWKNYLDKNLKSGTPKQNHAPAGAYTVQVEFIVSKDGDISAIKPLTNHGFGMEQEVVRLLQSGPSWKPAIQNGHKVNAYCKQAVTFVVS